MKKNFFIILILLLIVSCAQSKLDCRGKDPRCTDETGFDLIDIDFFWYGKRVLYRKGHVLLFSDKLLGIERDCFIVYFYFQKIYITYIIGRK